MATYTEQLQQITNRYIRETGASTFTTREIGCMGNTEGALGHHSLRR